ncbi:inactive pancreatic lipase-related protein 1-like isoform X2 [Photinus pyralis]|uniref:inactive pancreatic lipase-related protein 1-like isoform X2 n=1 Tax=Photinus pyralis TaxID=7054 RepID=UPI0012674BAB|nr:inactive pancreatic lipase-related protein 1-like isoform X2 [Photinus pyralis]
MIANGSVFMHTLIYVMNQSAVQQQESAYSYYYTDIDKGKGKGHFRVLSVLYCSNEREQMFRKLRLLRAVSAVDFGAPSHRTVPRRFKQGIQEEPEEGRLNLNFQIEPNYLYYSRVNPTEAVHIDLDDFDFVLSNNIDALLPTYTIAHGFLEGGGQTWIKRLVKELLIRENCNIIVIDWHGGSDPPYSQAVANIRVVGTITAHLLADLARHTGEQRLKHVHCIGHSLGAHLSGYIGYALEKDFNLRLGRITGLDPAEPHFARAQAPVRLDHTAADYVDVIHTDASAFIRGGFGIVEKIGHVDYYPNGGSSQPGCDRAVAQHISGSGSFFRGIRKFLGCNHIRSYNYFIESINSKCPFTSIACNSYEDLKSGTCFECGKNGQHCLKFGYHGRELYDHLIKTKEISPHKNLVQYLITGSDEPFCRAHYRITVDISNSTESKRHGGEVGQFVFKIHSTRDGKGPHSGEVILNEGGYHGPDLQYRAVVSGHLVSHLKTVDIEWRYRSSVINPLTWRLMRSPRIYVAKVQIEAMETRQSITVCPKNEEILSEALPQKMMSSYCP